MIELEKEASMVELSKSQKIELKIIHTMDTVGYHVAKVVGDVMRRMGSDG